MLRRRDLGAQHVEVVELGTARGGDLLGLLGGDQPDVGERSGERRLGVEPALHETLGVEDRAHRAVPYRSRSSVQSSVLGKRSAGRDRGQAAVDREHEPVT